MDGGAIGTLDTLCMNTCLCSIEVCQVNEMC